MYNFIHRRLVEANISKDVKLVDDAIEIMRHQRETWIMLMDKLSKERASAAQATVAANADSITSAEIAASSVPRAGGGIGVNDLPKGPVGAPGRRGYPAFAVRPVAVSAGLSVQG